MASATTGPPVAPSCIGRRPLGGIVTRCHRPPNLATHQIFSCRPGHLRRSPWRCRAELNWETPPPLRRSNKLSPSLLLTREAAMEAQLKALKNNNFPTSDHGLEVMYRFAGFDPWQRSVYFGRSLDLGT